MPKKTKSNLCRHGLQICEQCIIVTDAAKRMCDQINARLTFSNPWEVRSKWMAFRLNDGGTDGVIYDTREEAINHQIDERFCCYFTFRSAMSGAKPLDCQIFLNYYRDMYDANMRMHEPEAPQLILPTKAYDGHRYSG